MVVDRRRSHVSWTCQPINHLILSNAPLVPSLYSHLVVDRFVLPLRGKLNNVTTIPDGRKSTTFYDSRMDDTEGVLLGIEKGVWKRKCSRHSTGANDVAILT